MNQAWLFFVELKFFLNEDLRKGLFAAHAGAGLSTNNIS